MLIRIEQRGQLDEIDVHHISEPDAAGTYADLMESIGKAAQGGTLNEVALQKALAAGLAGKASDIGKVAMWVGQNCQL